MIVSWEAGPSKGGPCPGCSVFIGKIWNHTDIPSPPLHPNCACSLVSVTDYDPSAVQTDLIVSDPFAAEILIELVVYYINSNRIEEIPPFLLQFKDEALARIFNMTEPEPIRYEFTTEKELRAVLVEPGKTRTITGKDGRLSFTAQAITTAYDRGLFRGLSCFVDHSEGHPSIRNLLGTWTDVTNENGRITASLTPFITDETRPILHTLEQIRSMPLDQRPDLGLSLVLYPDKVSANGQIESIQMIESADLVLFPAVPSARFLFHSHGEEEMTDKIAAGTADKTWPTQPDPAWDKAYRQTAAAAIVNNSDLPALVKTRLNAADYATPEDVFKAIDDARTELASLHDGNVINLPGRPRIQMRDPLEEAQQIADFLFGAEGATVPSNMRRVDEWYKALTGDHEFRGVFNPDRLQFAGATTTTLADVAVNAMNKVIVEQMSNLAAWRWYERITSVEPNDGSLNPMKWITVGGIANLPQVSEGASYTELTVGDVSEADSFVKYGGYVGVTRELLKNSDIAKLQAIPRALANAAVRTRSAAVSYLFTQASGTGPTLEQDSTVLFHSNHSNVATTALGTNTDAWKAASLECFGHTEVTSGKKLGIFPRFCLVPADLYIQALTVFGYGEGMPTTYAPYSQDRGWSDPRPVPIIVPDWTDATDWAYIVDPQVYPVIQMSYSQAPGGRSHPAPELFAVVSPLSGLIFSNDTLPIKVRDEFAVGVNGPRGIGKRNVA